MIEKFTPRNKQPLERKTNNPKQKRLIAGGIFVALLGIAGGIFFYQASNVLTIAGSKEDVGVYKDFSVEEEENRIDVLVMGMRGAGDQHGGLLTDTILLLSFDKETKEAAMISIPRDLMVKIPEHHQPEKINFAYALGEERRRGGGGMALSREVVQYVTGVYVDHTAVVNFDGFKRIVNTLGGVTITRETPFYESEQWQGEGKPGSPFWYKTTRQVTSTDSGVPSGSSATSTDENSTSTTVQTETEEYWVFQVPAGRTTLNGEAALYYARSRFTSSDFDRAKRQQQIIQSLKEKAISLGILANPVKVFDILDAVGDNVRTDMSLGDIRTAVSLARRYSDASVKTVTFNEEEDGLLRSTYRRNQYVLLPKAGDDEFSAIRQRVQSVFSE